MENTRDTSELLKEIFWPSIDSKVSSAALLLALTSTISGEEKIKALLKKEKLKFCVTEVGGRTEGEFEEKVNRAVMGSSLNNGILEKTPKNIHAILHATEEAKRGLLINTCSSVSLAVKVAVVRDQDWIAVAIYGQSAIHPVTNHNRVGLGVMHI